MKWLCILATFFVLNAQEPEQLEIHKIVPIRSEKVIEPSGLTIWNGKLLTVDDKTDDTIFEIVVDNEVATIRPFLSLNVDKKGAKKLDFEGITHFDNHLFLASEYLCQILKVSPKGETEWLNIDVKKYGEKLGLFALHNAGIEGLTANGSGHLWIAAEREPRGLVKTHLPTKKILFGHRLEQGKHVAENVPLDFAGLYFHHQKLWALFRNAHEIVEVQEKENKFILCPRYSFKDVLLSQEYRYEDMHYGIAEGLAIDDNFFYIVVDNNRMSRNKEKSDQRPLLCILKKKKSIFSKAYGNPKHPAIIFLHGGPGYHSVNFEHAAAKQIAQKGYYVIVYDRRGSGRSLKNKAKYTFKESTEDLNDIYKEYKLTQATLIGHSFGGTVALRYAQTHSEKIKNIILVGSPFHYPKMFQAILKNCEKKYTKIAPQNLKYIDMIRKIDSYSLQYSSYAFYHAMQCNLYSPRIVTEAAKQLYATASKYSISMKQEPVIGFFQNEKYTSLNLEVEWKKESVRLPIYGIYGKEDGLFDASQMNTIQSILGVQNFHIIKNASHNVFIDQREEFIKILHSLLSR